MAIHATRYEELRESTLSRRDIPRHGLCLILLRGVSAWLDEWTAALPTASTSSPARPSCHGSRLNLSSAIGEEAVNIMASMALAQIQEQ